MRLMLELKFKFWIPCLSTLKCKILTIIIQSLLYIKFTFYINVFSLYHRLNTLSIKQI